MFGELLHCGGEFIDKACPNQVSPAPAIVKVSVRIFDNRQTCRPSVPLDVLTLQAVIGIMLSEINRRRNCHIAYRRGYLPR
jgi:hypothetical protein